MITIRRTVYLDDRGQLQHKDTKTHQQRRVVLDPETAAVLREHRIRAEHQAAAIEAQLDPACYVFSGDPGSRTPLNSEGVTQRYKRMAASIGVDTTLKNLRHYSATELVSAGVDVRTVAHRLGHGGGGATTLRVYTACTAEADQRAARTVSGRMPGRSHNPDRTNHRGHSERPADDKSPYGLSPGQSPSQARISGPETALGRRHLSAGALWALDVGADEDHHVHPCFGYHWFRLCISTTPMRPNHRTMGAGPIGQRLSAKSDHPYIGNLWRGGHRAANLRIFRTSDRGNLLLARRPHERRRGCSTEQHTAAICCYRSPRRAIGRRRSRSCRSPQPDRCSRRNAATVIHVRHGLRPQIK